MSKIQQNAGRDKSFFPQGASRQAALLITDTADNPEIAVKSWGRHLNGQLGHIDNFHRSMPMQAIALHGFAKTLMVYCIEHMTALTNKGEIFPTEHHAIEGQCGTF